MPFPEFQTPGLADACAGKQPTDLVFSDRFGQHLKRTRVSVGTRSWFLTALTTAGLPRMLGHASAAMTLDIYVDLFDADLDAVATLLNQAATFSNVAKMLPREDSGQEKTPTSLEKTGM